MTRETTAIVTNRLVNQVSTISHVRNVRRSGGWRCAHEQVPRYTRLRADLRGRTIKYVACRTRGPDIRELIAFRLVPRASQESKKKKHWSPKLLFSRKIPKKRRKITTQDFSAGDSRARASNGALSARRDRRNDLTGTSARFRPA